MPRLVNKLMTREREIYWRLDMLTGGDTKKPLLDEDSKKKVCFSYRKVSQVLSSCPSQIRKGSSQKDTVGSGQQVNVVSAAPVIIYTQYMRKQSFHHRKGTTQSSA